jgi:hypothetical protein
VRAVDHPGSLGLWQKGPHGQCLAAAIYNLMRTQHLKWILVINVDYRSDRFQCHLRFHGDVSFVFCSRVYDPGVKDPGYRVAYDSLYFA